MAAKSHNSPEKTNPMQINQMTIVTKVCQHCPKKKVPLVGFYNGPKTNLVLNNLTTGRAAGFEERSEKNILYYKNIYKYIIQYNRIY